MTTYLDQLVAEYKYTSRIKDFGHIPAADQVRLQQWAEAPGPDLIGAAHELVQMLRATTSVAVLSYQFFTGKAPRETGLDYLISPEGPNPANLNSALYANFNLENRYINFAVNLGKAGEGAANFLAGYGALDLHQAVAKAYETIFGVVATTAKVAELLDVSVGTMTRGEYFAAIGGDGLDGTGTKAAAVGWLLAEAAKTDHSPIGLPFGGGYVYPTMGPYAYALHQFIVDLARDGHARFDEDIVANYDRGKPYVYDGPLDEGGPGLTFAIASDTDLQRPYGAGNGFATPGYATEGNDLVSSVTGYGPFHTISTGAGNDTVSITGGGLMGGSIDVGDGNDVVTLETFVRGSISVGAGQNTVNINGIGPLFLDAIGHVDVFQMPWLFVSTSSPPLASDSYIVDDKPRHDTVNLGPALGAGQILSAVFAGSTTLDEALAFVSANTAAGTNSVFRFGADAFIYHQDAVAGVDVGDGLIRIFGFGAPASMLDIHFG